jgi:hypothetical protein
MKAEGVSNNISKFLGGAGSRKSQIGEGHSAECDKGSWPLTFVIIQCVKKYEAMNFVLRNFVCPGRKECDTRVGVYMRYCLVPNNRSTKV